MATPTKEVIQRLVGLGYPESVAKRIAGGELPMDYASRMQRAADQGYSPVQYHGTRANITEFQPSDKGKMGGGVYTAAYPRQSNMHATPGFNSNRMNTEQIDPSVLNEELLINSGANVLPVVTRGNYANRWDAIKANPELYGPEADRMLTQRLIDQGYDGIDLTGYGSKRAEGDLKERVTFDPNNIRSLLSAAFDPEYTGSNIMGSRLAPTAAAGLLGAGAMMAPENAEAAPYGTREDLIAGIEEKLRPLPEPEPTIAPTENDTIGQIVNTVANLFGGGYHDYRAAENLMNGADFLPYVGSGISLQQGADAYRQGKVGEGRLLTGLGLLEFIPVAGKIASEAAKARRAGRAANRSLDDFASRMSESEIATRAPQTQEELMRALGWQ